LAEQLKAKGQSGGTLAVGQEAEMADAHKALREDVQQEAP
jgi:hypothetical protein